MPLFLTVIFCVFLLFVVVDIVNRYWKVPVLASFAVSLALLVAYETVILNVLSVFRIVLPIPVVIAHLPAIGMWAWYYISNKNDRNKIRIDRYRVCIRNIFKTKTFYTLIPIVIILFIGAVMYPPNTYDSMSYHMARVAHWMQQQSIGYYQTSIHRQNVMGPGAEYLILIPQILSRTDYLANIIQYLSYVFLISSILYIVGMLRISWDFRPFITLLTAAAPMAIMQATSTQNDLVASVMAYAVIISGRRLFIGRIERFLYRDYALLGICIASGFLVKPTSLIAAFPFLLIGFFRQLPSIIKRKHIATGCLIGGCIFLIAITLVSAPDIMRKLSVHLSRYEVYKLTSGWNVPRFQNPIAMAGHNVVFPSQPRKFLAKLGYKGPFDNREALTLHEDLIGNPFQLMAMGALSIVTFLLFGAAIRKKKLLLPFFLSLSPLAAWVVFGLIVKDQLWITRLQLPLFFLLPFSFTYVLAVATRSKFAIYLLKMIISGVAFFAVSYAIIVAGNNPHRPVKLDQFFGHPPDRTWSYYNNTLYEDRVAHQTLLNVARTQGCRKVGLVLGGNSDEYPLIWRLMQEGRKAKHVLPRGHHDNQDWACLYYVDTGQDYRLHGKGLQWLPVDKHTYMRNLAYEFDRSNEVELEKVFSAHGGTFFKNYRNVVLTSGANGIEVKALTNDPQLVLPDFSYPKSGWIIIKVILNCPAKTQAQVFYTTKMQPEYSEEQSFKQDIESGEHTVFFQIPADGLRGSVRFDPGKIAGSYLIKSISIHGLSD
jgi:hypothetical protein